MKFSVKVVMLFLMSALMISYGALATEAQEDDESIEEKCQNEARAAGMVSADEIHDYVEQCVEELSTQEGNGEGRDSAHASHE